MSTPLHQLSLGPNPMFASGLYYDGANNPHAYVSVRPYPTPMQMSAPMAVPIISMAGTTLGATEQIPEATTVAFSGDSARGMLQRPMAISNSGPFGMSNMSTNIPYPFPMWPMLASQGYSRPANSPLESKVVRPTAKVSTEPLTVGEDETKEMSKLNLGLSPPEPSQLTQKLMDQPSRQLSAFHVNSSCSTTNPISSSSNAISVVWWTCYHAIKKFWFDAELEWV